MSAYGVRRLKAAGNGILDGVGRGRAESRCPSMVKDAARHSLQELKQDFPAIQLSGGTIWIDTDGSVVIERKDRKAVKIDLP